MIRKFGSGGKAKSNNLTQQALENGNYKDQGQQRRNNGRGDGEGQLISLIGYLTATRSEDWGLILEITELASANENNAKEALRALRNELKYGDPISQLAAARLWAVLMRNVPNEPFISPSTNPKFTAALEDLVISYDTSPVVRDRILDVIAAAAYASKDGKGFRPLWKRVKPPDKPDEGVPLDIEDAMFPPIVSAPTPPYIPLPLRVDYPPSPRHHIIPQDEDIRRLFHECKVGRDSAIFLLEALAHSQPEDLKKKDIIKGLYLKCRFSQELIFGQISWASGGAEISRRARDEEALMNNHPEEQRLQQTLQEKLLASLLSATAELMNALQQYDDRERVAEEGAVTGKEEAVAGKEEENRWMEMKADFMHLQQDMKQDGEFLTNAPFGQDAGISGSPPARPQTPSPNTAPAQHHSHPHPTPLPLTRYGPRSSSQGVQANPQLRPLLLVLKHKAEEGKHDSTYLLNGGVGSEDEMSTNGTEHFDMSQLPLASPSQPLVEVPPRITLAKLPRYDSSTTSEPADWLEASHEHLLDYIIQSKRDRIVQKECTGWSAVRCHSPVRLTSDRFQRLLKGDSVPTGDGPRHDVDDMRAVVALDVDVICVRLYRLVKDEEQYRRLLHLQGNKAQALLDLVQSLLDLPSLERIFKSPFLNALLRLSRRSKHFPGRLWQEQVTLEGTEAITAGRFGEVWKGIFCGQGVAVKVLKIYQKSDLDKHIKKVLQETVIWRQLRHVNVLPFLCLHLVDNTERRIGLVSPWMKNGNVKEFLQRSPNVDRMSLVTDIAEGLEYLHTMEPKIVHGDLKAVHP
ncbi:hypothetical protein DXG01_011065 [Tephrocybe rancida]|nr:hypothetical protein DXG01_011065 [Tephrocybe rancida]